MSDDKSAAIDREQMAPDSVVWTKKMPVKRKLNRKKLAEALRRRRKPAKA